MCYRFQQTWPNPLLGQAEQTNLDDLLGQLFGIEEPPDYVRASNIAPTDNALVVTNTIPHGRLFPLLHHPKLCER